MSPHFHVNPSYLPPHPDHLHSHSVTLATPVLHHSSPPPPPPHFPSHHPSPHLDPLVANAHTLLNGGDHAHADPNSYSSSALHNAHHYPPPPSSPSPPSSSNSPLPPPFYSPQGHSHPLLYPYPSPPASLSYPPLSPDVAYYHPSAPSSFAPSSPLPYDPTSHPPSSPPPPPVKGEPMDGMGDRADGERGGEGMQEGGKGGSGSSKRRRLELTDGEGRDGGREGEDGTGEEEGEDGEEGEEEAEADADPDASSLSSSSSPPSPSQPKPSKVEIPPAMNRSIIECFDPATQLLVLPPHPSSPPAFLSLDDLLDLQRTSPSHRHLRVGSYNEAEGTLEYHPLAAPVFVKEGEHRMVDVREPGENSGSVVLSVTREHSVYVRFGGAGDEWEGRGWHRTEAAAMLGGEGRDAMQFRGNARAGFVRLQSSVDPLCPPPCFSALQLSSEDEELAFCELYGAFLASGALSWEERSVILAAPEVDGADYLTSVLARLHRVLPCRPGSWRMQPCEGGDESTASEFVIQHPAWWTLLAEQHEPAYCEPSRGQGLEHSLPTSPQTPSPSSSVSSSPTSVTRILPSSPSSSSRSVAEDDEPLSPHAAATDAHHKPNPRLLPWVLLSLHHSHLRHILRGYRQSSNECDAVITSVYTASTSFRDELLLLCLHAGYSAHFEWEQSQWAVRYTDSDAAQPILRCRRDVSERSFTGRVFCVTVPPHHLIIARTVLARDAAGVVIAASRPIVVGQCGIIDPVTSTRQLSHHSSYFNKTVEVYTAVSDPSRRTLYRASALAEKFACATNKVGMYLARRRHCESGLWQSVGFRHKPSGRTGLKAGGYFLSQEICESFQFHFQKQVGRRRERKGAAAAADGDKGDHSEKQGKKRGKKDSERAADKVKAEGNADSVADGDAYPLTSPQQDGDSAQQPTTRDEETERRMEAEAASPTHVKREAGAKEEQQQPPPSVVKLEPRGSSPGSDDGLQHAHTILTSTSPAPPVSPHSYSTVGPHDTDAYPSHSPHSHSHALPLPHLHSNGIDPSSLLPAPHPHGQDQHLLYTDAVPLGMPVGNGAGVGGGDDRGGQKLEGHPAYYGDPAQHAVAAVVMDARVLGEQMDNAQLLSPHLVHLSHPHAIAPLPAHTLQHAAHSSLEVSMDSSQPLLHHTHEQPPHFHPHPAHLQHIDHSVEQQHALHPPHLYPSHLSHPSHEHHGLSFSQHAQHPQHLDMVAHELLHAMQVGMGGHGGGHGMYSVMDGGGGVGVVNFSSHGMPVGEHPYSGG